MNCQGGIWPRCAQSQAESSMSKKRFVFHSVCIWIILIFFLGVQRFLLAHLIATLNTDCQMECSVTLTCKWAGNTVCVLMNARYYIRKSETCSLNILNHSLFLHSVYALGVFTNLSWRHSAPSVHRWDVGAAVSQPAPRSPFWKQTVHHVPCHHSHGSWSSTTGIHWEMICVIGGPLCARIVVLTPSHDFQRYFFLVHIIFSTQLQIDYYLVTCWRAEEWLAELYLGHRRSYSGKNDWLFLHWMSSRDTVAYHKASSVLLLRSLYQSRLRPANEKHPIILILGSIFPLYASECLFKSYCSISNWGDVCNWQTLSYKTQETFSGRWGDWGW